METAGQCLTGYTTILKKQVFNAESFSMKHPWPVTTEVCKLKLMENGLIYPMKCLTLITDSVPPILNPACSFIKINFLF